MKKYSILAAALTAVSVILAIVCFILLPQTVIVQFSTGSNYSTMPKLLAVLIPFAIGVGGALMSLTIKDDTSKRIKCFIVSAVGIAVFVIMLVVNL